MYSIETKARLEVLRAKSLANLITLEEQREAVILFREGRTAAIAIKPARAVKAAKPALELD